MLFFGGDSYPLLRPCLGIPILKEAFLRETKGNQWETKMSLYFSYKSPFSKKVGTPKKALKKVGTPKKTTLKRHSSHFWAIFQQSNVTFPSVFL